MGGQWNSSGWTLHQKSLLERCAHPLNPRSDLLEKMDGGVALATRDFALLTLAGHLSARFPGEFV